MESKNKKVITVFSNPLEEKRKKEAAQYALEHPESRVEDKKYAFELSDENLLVEKLKDVCTRRIHTWSYRSVDCNLQVTWDINSDIAPIQAEVVSDRGNLYLIALETGVVMNKKPVNLEKKIRLYHGDKFTIGQTIFTYIEKDI